MTDDVNLSETDEDKSDEEIIEALIGNCRSRLTDLLNENIRANGGSIIVSADNDFGMPLTFASGRTEMFEVEPAGIVYDEDKSRFCVIGALAGVIKEIAIENRHPVDFIAYSPKLLPGEMYSIRDGSIFDDVWIATFTTASREVLLAYRDAFVMSETLVALARE